MYYTQTYICIRGTNCHTSLLLHILVIKISILLSGRLSFGFIIPCVEKQTHSPGIEPEDIYMSTPDISVIPSFNKFA